MKASKSTKRRSPAASALAVSQDLLALEIGRMIEAARRQVAQTANAALTTLHWQIGTRIRQDVLKERRAEYGAEIVASLGRQLEAQFGRGFGEKNLRRMVQFAETFPDVEIVAALRRQLGWAHFKVHPDERSLEARLLRRDVPDRGLAAARARLDQRTVLDVGDTSAR